jgi:molybdopterin-guanine dinucleotide biosynthesis protein A
LKLDALVLAGGAADTGDPLHRIAPGGRKALIALGGRPMAQWVIEALALSPRIARIVLIGLPLDAPVYHPQVAARLPDRGSLLENIRAGAEWIAGHGPAAPLVVAASADLPAITPAMVTWVVDTARQTEDDLYYVVVPGQIMEARFPGSGRASVRLRDGIFTGGDLHVLRLSLAPGARFWEAVYAARKNILRLTALLGADTLLLLALRRLTLAQLEGRISRRAGLRCRAMVSPYAELGMDVDTPHQLSMIEKSLEGRSPTRPQ